VSVCVQVYKVCALYMCYMSLMCEGKRHVCACACVCECVYVFLCACKYIKYVPYTCATCILCLKASSNPLKQFCKHHLMRVCMCMCECVYVFGFVCVQVYRRVCFLS